MSAENTSKPRPYWHVDAKWITGLLLTFVVSVTVLIYGLVQITAEEPAVNTLTYALALMYSRNGLDDETEVAVMRQMIQASPDKTIQPLPNLDITISEQDIEGLTPREVRLFFFRKWAEPIYQDGIKGLAALSTTPGAESEIIQGGAIFNVLTRKTHESLRQALVIAAAITLTLLIPLIYFSYRFGRIGSPGCVAFVASLPGALLFTFIALAVKPANDLPAEDAGITGMTGYLLSNLLPPLAQIVSRSYLIVLALGGGLLLLAVLGSVGWKARRKEKPARGKELSAPRQDEPPISDHSDS
jgi:hypothetical protein